jgi:hypothetical protein
MTNRSNKQENVTKVSDYGKWRSRYDGRGFPCCVGFPPDVGDPPVRFYERRGISSPASTGRSVRRISAGAKPMP